MPMLLLLLSVLVIAPFDQAPAGVDPRNLLDNPTADRSLQGWMPYGDAGVESCDGEPCFVLKNRETLTQNVSLPADASGKFLVIIGSGWTERLDPQAITGLPYLYGSVLQGSRIVAYFQGQQMLARPATANQWVPMFGIFQLPAGGGNARLSGQPGRGSRGPPEWLGRAIR